MHVVIQMPCACLFFSLACRSFAQIFIRHVSMKLKNSIKPQFKHKVLEEYRCRISGCGFKSLAKRFKIKGGHRLVMKWRHQWDGTVDSLNQKLRGHRTRVMTQQEVADHILEFVKSLNEKRMHVNYRTVQAHVKFELKREVPIRTIRRYGKECGIRWLKTREVTPRDG